MYSLLLFSNSSCQITIAIREEKNLKQIEVATHIGVDKSGYSKIEKGLRAVTVEELQKLAGIFNMTTDQILNYDGKRF